MKRIIIIIFLVIIASVVWYSISMYKMQTPDVVNKKPDVVISAKDLLMAFNKDTAAASKMYVDQLIEVKGTLKSADTLAIVLGEPGSQSSIVCGVDRRHMNDYKKIKVGSAAVVQGTCVGYEKGEEMLGVSLGTTVHLNYAGVKNKP